MKFEGHFWVLSNNFGSCLGGSHPLVNTPYKRSTGIYTVLKTFVSEETCLSLSLPCAAFFTRILSPEVRGFVGSEQLRTIIEKVCMKNQDTTYIDPWQGPFYFHVCRNKAYSKNLGFIAR